MIPVTQGINEKAFQDERIMTIITLNVKTNIGDIELKTKEAFL